MQFVTLSFKGPVATATLNSPSGNRINFAMRAELKETFELVRDSPAQCLVIAAVGADFSLGGDIREWPGLSSLELRPRVEVFAHALSVLESLPIPTIASVQGQCLGGGFELALACDMIVAEQSARFAFPEARLGIMTLQGGIYRLAQRIGASKALALVMLSEVVPAMVYLRMGVVSKVADDGSLARLTASVAAELGSGPTRAYAATKELLRVWRDGGFQAAQAAMYQLSMPLFDASDVQQALVNAAHAAEHDQPFERQSFLAPPAI